MLWWTRSPVAGGAVGAEPRLAELQEKGVPLSELPDVLEALLEERFGARRRGSGA